MGLMLDFKEQTADVRISQYEAETHIPRKEMVEKIAKLLEVSSDAIMVPNIESPNSIIHTLFALEDMEKLTITEKDHKPYLVFNKDKTDPELMQMLELWKEKQEAYKNGEITKEEYDSWRYNLK